MKNLKRCVAKRIKEKEEHQIILKLLIESDERIKKLLELEEVKKLEIKFMKHPKSKKFCDPNEKLAWQWLAHENKKISVPLDENNSILPHNKDKRLCVLAHELGHLILGKFPFLNFQDCDNQLRNCLSTELRAYAIGVELLQKISVQFEKSFWSNKLIYKWNQCKECLKIINQGKCPEKERERIKESLNVIVRSIKA